MIFKNESQLKAFLMAKCKNAMIKAQEQVYQIIDRFVKEFYAEYTPVMYERTYQLYRSLVKSDIVSDGNGYKAEVYVDLNYLNYIYSTGSHPSGKDVMDAADRGEHGVERVAAHGTEIWNESIQKLDANAINILKDMLISEGIPIK